MKMLVSSSILGAYIHNVGLKGDITPLKKTDKVTGLNINFDIGFYYLSNTFKQKGKEPADIGRLVFIARRSNKSIEGPFNINTWKYSLDSEMIDRVLSYDKNKKEVKYGVFLCANEKNTDVNAFYVSYEDFKNLVDYNGENTKITITIRRVSKVGSGYYNEIYSRPTNGGPNPKNIAYLPNVDEQINWQ